MDCGVFQRLLLPALILVRLRNSNRSELINNNRVAWRLTSVPSQLPSQLRSQLLS